MRTEHIFVFFVIVLLLFPEPSSAKDLQVGVSPNRINAGEIAVGSEKYFSFSLVTQSSNEILVQLGALKAGMDIFDRPENYDLRNISSEEDSSGWISFPANPITILPLNGSLPTLGGSISGWRSAGFNIKVPENAEPCYHAFQIKPSPYVSTTYDTGVSIAAITVVTVLFKVPGNCVRDGSIIDIQQGANTDRNVVIDTYFRNTGSATISARASDIRIYAENGSEISSSTSGTQVLKPGELGVFKVYFSPAVLESGKTYKVTSTVSYGTGVSSKSVLLTMEYKKLPIEAAPSESAGFSAYLSGIIVFILILLILAASYYVYKRE